MTDQVMGLSEKEVKLLEAEGKVNIMTDSISRTTKEIIKAHTFTFFNFLNVFLGVLVLTTGQIKNLTFMGTIIANSLIGIIQELRVKKQVDQLSVITASKATVIRDGQKQEIPLQNIVLGDIMCLEAGQQIGADCQVLQAEGVEVNEAMITGESDAVKKKAGDEMMSGSHVVAGTCMAEVIRVGDDNYAAALAAKAKNKRRASSEMQDAIGRIIKVIGILIVPVGILLYISQKSVPEATWSTAIISTVAGVIGMIPEGLVLLTSVSFIVGVGKLASKRALVQEMEAIEALARVNVLCLDKTGTITSGDLEVVSLEPLTADGRADELKKTLTEVVKAFADENATQKALLAYCSEAPVLMHSRLIPFSSARKYRAVQFENGKAYALGAPEFIMDPRTNPELMKKVNSFAAEGMRVLLLAGLTDMDTVSGRIFGPRPLALVVISDCIRQEAAASFAYFASQNVAIKVVSGDNPATVSRIAMKAGLVGGDQYIDAGELPEDFEDLKRVVKQYNVFGRVTPEQKQKIIKAYQANRFVVGMVGDGVNDVLALKDADCGVAMAAGADAAKQAAHIVLLDSDFSRMKDIVKEGRTIISNIERVSSLYLTKTIYSLLLCVIFILLKRSYPFIPIHLTLISTLAIGIPSFFLAIEPTETVTSTGFLKHVLKVALPGALTMVLSMLTIQGAGTLLGFDAAIVSVFNLIIAGGISLMVLVKVSLPMNLMRRILCSVMAALFVLAIIILPELFGVTGLFTWRMIFIFPLMIATYFVMEWLSAGVKYALRGRI